MFRKLHTRFLIALFLLGSFGVVICSAQEEDRAAKKTQTTDVEIYVTDKDGIPIDNVQVQVKWGDEDADSQKAVTNKHGIAKAKEIPQGTVTIRLIANGYKSVAPSVNLKTEKQPIKLSLEKNDPHIGE